MGFGETYQVSHSHYRGPLLLGGMDAEAPFQCGNHLYSITVWSNAKVPIQCQGVPNSEAWAEGDLLEQGINGECRVKSKHSGLRNGSPEPDGEIGCPQDSSLLQRRPGSEQGVEASPLRVRLAAPWCARSFVSRAVVSHAYWAIWASGHWHALAEQVSATNCSARMSQRPSTIRH